MLIFFSCCVFATESCNCFGLILSDEGFHLLSGVSPANQRSNGECDGIMTISYVANQIRAADRLTKPTESEDRVSQISSRNQSDHGFLALEVKAFAHCGQAQSLKNEQKRGVLLKDPFPPHNGPFHNGGFSHVNELLTPC